MVGGVGAVGVVLGDHLLPENLDHLEDLLMGHALDGQAEDHLVAPHLLIAGHLLAHLLGGPAEQVAALDGQVQHLVCPTRVVGRVRPGNGVRGLGHGVVVEVDHGDQVAPTLGFGDRPGCFPVLEADHRVGHHHVVVPELSDLLDRVDDGLLVGLHPTLQVVDRLEVEGDGPDAHRPGFGEGGRVPTGHPERRVAGAVGLGEDVVRGGHGEVLAVEVVVLLLPHTRDLPYDLVPHGFRLVGVEDVEHAELVTAGTPTGAELESAVRDVVEHGGALSDPGRVLLLGREAGDGRADVDVVSLGGHVAHERGGSRHMAVLA